MNKIILLIVLFVFISSHITGCDRRPDGSLKIPFVYRIDVQQGNVIEQSMINKLEPGMTRAKVKFIMGTPLLADSFHSNRWDYIYSNEPGDGERAQRHVALFFKNDKLTHLEGDITHGSKHSEEDANESLNILITDTRKKEGFFSGFFDDWFGSDEELKKKPTKPEMKKLRKN